MWILFAFGSALFAGITAILAKIGIKRTDSNVATALRTIVVLIFSWLLVFIDGSYKTIGDLTLTNLLFLILSGLCTGASWLCYFKALQLGDVNKVTPVDKSSTILTMILAFIFLGEKITAFMLIGMVCIAIGTVLMLQKRELSDEEKEKQEENEQKHRYAWFFFALGSAFFASLTAILGKVGIQGVNSNLGTAIRTIVVLVMAWMIVGLQKKTEQVKEIDAKSWIFIILSGVSTGLSWLCYYRALQDGYASVVVPIDKLSIVFTVAFSRIFLNEKLSKKAAVGLGLIVAGTLVLLL